MSSGSNLNKYTMAGFVMWLTFSAGLAAAQPTAAGSLALSLQSSLDSEGITKATSITKAEMLDGSTVVKTATITGGTARFNLSGIASGDYFIRVNGLNDDLVPTRIDDPTSATNQSVGQKLRVSVIGDLSDPAYRIETFSKGQGRHPVVSSSDGTNLTPERYAYIMLSLKASPQKLEIRVLGMASQLNNFTPATATHPSTSTATNPPSSTWMVMTSGSAHHGDDYNETDSKCNNCHGNLDTKPATFLAITVNNGWCYRCHYGKGGSDEGFIDATLAAVTAVPTTTTATTTATAMPTATPRAPAFGVLFAISALLAAILVRRR